MVCGTAAVGTGGTCRSPSLDTFSSLGWGQQWLTGLDACETLSGSGVKQVREGTIHLKSLCGLRDEGLTDGWHLGPPLNH